MNITLNNIDSVNATITVEIKKEDYESEVNKSLKKLKSTASIPGFRPGMAPMGMIQKLYGKSALIEEVNKKVIGELYDYIKESKLNLLGEPLPHEDDTKDWDFDTPSDYEFTFDIALSPTLDPNLSKDDILPYYNIIVEKKTIDEKIESLQQNYGTYEQAEEVEDKDMVKGRLIELNPDGTPVEGGIDEDGSVLMPAYIKDEEEKTKFMGAKVGDVIVFNPHKAYDGSETELSSFFKIGKDMVGLYKGDFSLQIEEITRYQKAALGKEFYEKLYGEDVVKNRKELEAKVKEEFEEQLRPDSDYKFLLDAKKLMMEKTKDVVFPDAFLKRWLMQSEERHTPESLEENYPKMIDDLRFHLIKDRIIKDNEIKVDIEDVRQAAAQVAMMQFAQYGMSNVPQSLLDNYVDDMMLKEDTTRNLINKVTEDKVIAVIKEKVTLEPKEVKVADLNKLFEDN